MSLELRTVSEIPRAKTPAGDSGATSLSGTVGDGSSLSFRVLTVNTHKGFGFFNRRFILRELREAVRAVKADVVFLQEVMGEHAVHATRVKDWPDKPHYEFLADTMWTETAYGRNAVYPHGHHGNAVLSRFPIVRHENHDATLPGDETRGLLHCVLQPPAGPELHMICVHLGLREAHRQSQLQQLCDLVVHGIPADAPVVVAGDFNDWRLRGHRLLCECAGLCEVVAGETGEPARTFPSRFPWLRLDRIYVRNAKVQQPLVLPRHPWSHLSDHAPLAAEIHL